MAHEEIIDREWKDTAAIVRTENSQPDHEFQLYFEKLEFHTRRALERGIEIGIELGRRGDAPRFKCARVA